MYAVDAARLPQIVIFGRALTHTQRVYLRLGVHLPAETSHPPGRERQLHHIALLCQYIAWIPAATSFSCLVAHSRGDVWILLVMSNSLLAVPYLSISIPQITERIVLAMAAFQSSGDFQLSFLSV